MARRLTQVRKDGTVNYLRPDGKTQVTVEYDENHQPVRVDTVVLSTQHSPEVTLEQIRKDMIDLVIRPTVPAELLDENTKIYVNPTGRFVIGGPQGDTGLTGRKIIVDTYGGSAPPRRRRLLRQGPHQGGPLRRLRRPLGSQERGGRGPCQAVPGPAGLRHRRGPARQRPGGDLRHRHRGRRGAGAGRAQDVFDLRPTAIIRDLDLQKPIYQQLAAYGHMGREDLGVRWEITDRADQLKAACQ